MRAVKRASAAAATSSSGKCCYHSSSVHQPSRCCCSSSTSSQTFRVPLVTPSSCVSSSRSYHHCHHQPSPSSPSSRVFRHQHQQHQQAAEGRASGNSAARTKDGRGTGDAKTSSFRLTNGILYGLPTLLAIALYLNTLRAGFVYDDHRAILGNRDVVGSGPWWWVCVHDFWGSPLSRRGSHGSWRPITTLTFRWDAAFSSLLTKAQKETTPKALEDAHGNPASSLPVPFLTPTLNAPLSALPFHASNVVLHAAVTAAYVGVLRHVGVGPWACLGAGSLFAAHPIHVEAVAGVVGRAELLAALAFCLALAAYVNYLRGRGSSSSSETTQQQQRRRWAWAGVVGRRVVIGCHGHTCVCWESHHAHKPAFLRAGAENLKWWSSFPPWAWLVVSVGGAGLAMACKEQGVTVLGVGLVMHAAAVVSTTPKNKPVVVGLIKELWPGTLGTAILIWLRVSITAHSPSFTPADNPAAHAQSLLTRALSISHSWAVHWRLLLWPATLSFDWSMGAVPLVTSLADCANIETLALGVLLGCGFTRAFRSCWVNRTRQAKRCSSYYSPHAYHDELNNNVSLAGGGAEEDDDEEDEETEEVVFVSPTSESSFFTPSSAACVLASYNQNHKKLSSCRRQLMAPGELHLLLGWSLLVMPFLPASNLLAYVGFVVAERVLYIPSMGACLLVALGAQALWRQVSGGKSLLRNVVLQSPTSSSSPSTAPSSPAPPRRQRRRAGRRRFRVAFAVAWAVTLALMGARTVRRNEDWRSDEALYRSGVEVNPPKALSNLGVVYSEQGRLKEAEFAYREALRHVPNMADTHYNLGLLLASRGNMDSAIESYHAALRSRPWLAQAHLALAAAFQAMDQPNKALKVLKECRNTASAPARDGWSHAWAVTSCHKRLAHIHIVAGRPHSALEELSQALHLAPEGYPVHTLHTLTAEAHLEAGEYREAQEVLSRVLALHPHHVPAHLAFSRMLQANGSRVEEAEQWLRRAVALAPSDPHAHKHLGQLLLEQNRVEEAVKAWLRAAMLDTQDHTAAFNAATALRLAGSHQHAENFYRRAVQLQPQDVSSHRNLGAILHLNGKLEEARRHYEIALKLSPGDPQTTTNLHRLKALVSKKGVS
ncbi:LOW QUALITY PROTEIN: protein O-mannosyl-transferase TMTC2-like [Macrobrachium nipponense]|uniref:LOW QUALITY PROTEIN: protein O-mannosyl-transferase TMTC2-like n=1 Tax=Macrobrachium nipponense TaxID=159736 RepID=UPI0030C7F74F